MVPKEEFSSLQALPSREAEMQQMWQKHILLFMFTVCGLKTIIQVERNRNIKVKRLRQHQITEKPGCRAGNIEGQDADHHLFRNQAIEQHWDGLCVQ